MDILKAFSLYDKEFPINIQGTIENPLFQANQIGKLLEMANIHKVIGTYGDELKVFTESYTSGGRQQLAFLTEAGLYRLLSRSNKPIALIFQTWMINVLKEIRLNGEYKLRQDREVDLKMMQERSKRDLHSKMMELCHKKNVVYFCKIREENEESKFLLKIGSTQNIKERLSNIETNYRVTPVLLDIIECPNHTKFESWLRNNNSIKSVCFPIEKHNGSTTRETFLVTLDEYETIVKLARDEIKHFNAPEMDPDTQLKIAELNLKSKEFDYETNGMQLKLAELNFKSKDLEYKMLQTPKMSMTKTDNQSEISELSNDIQLLETSLVKRREHSRSPKVYQYDPDTLEHLNTYDSIIDVIRTFHSSSPSALKESVKNNTIYKNFRWLFAERHITEPPIPGPSIIVRAQSIEYIAMIDIKRTHIINVFPSQKEAAMARNLAGFSTISRAIKNDSLSSGHYWQIFEKCSQEMRDQYLDNHTLPEKHVKANGIFVNQIDPITNETIHTYRSMNEVLLKYQMSRTTLKKVSTNNEVHNGYRWQIVNN